MIKENAKNIKIIFFSTLLINSCFLLFLKISPQFFIFFNFLPIFLVGLIVPIKISIISYLFAITSIYFTTNIFWTNPDETLPKTFNFFVFSIFFLGISYISILNFFNKKRLGSIGDVISFYILISSIFLMIVFKFYFTEINIDLLLNEIKKIYFSQIEDQEKQIHEKIDLILNFFLKIIPSINITFILTLTLINFHLAEKIIKSLKLNSNSKLSYSNFKIPNWYLYILIVFFLASFINESFEVFFLNLFIVYSFAFILDGILIFLKFFEKINLNNFLKYLLLFLLFIFFSYLLLIVLFIFGLNKKLREVFKNFNISGG